MLSVSYMYDHLMIQSSNTNSVKEVVKKNFQDFAIGAGSAGGRARLPFLFKTFQPHGLSEHPTPKNLRLRHDRRGSTPESNRRGAVDISCAGPEKIFSAQLLPGIDRMPPSQYASTLGSNVINAWIGREHR